MPVAITLFLCVRTETFPARPQVYGLGSGGRTTRVVRRGITVECDRRPTVHADRHGARDRDPLAAAMRVAVIEHRDVLGGAVVPNGEVADAPTPPDGVLRPRH